MVCYAEKQEKPFWFSSLGQMVQFGAIIFCRTFKNYFGQFVWIEKKSHYNSRVSLHEAPTKNTVNVHCNDLKGNFLFCIVLLFLVGAFLVKRARLLQWLVFFLFFQTTDLIVYVLFNTDFNRFMGTRRSWVRVLALARNFFEHLRKQTRLKGPLFQFFFGTGRLFSIFFAFKGSLFKFF